MFTGTVETKARTTQDGTLNLSVNVGLPDTEVAVVLTIRPAGPNGELDANGWPTDFLERVAGSMPELARARQGDFEQRLTLE